MGRTVPMMAALLLLAGCSSGDAPADAATSAKAPAGPNADYTTAAAVGSTNAAPAKLLFRLGGKPAAGQNLPVSIRVLPTVHVDKLQAFFELDPGLSFVDEVQASFVTGGLPAGGSQGHELQILPAQTGVYLLKVTVMTDADGASKASTYAIPVIVGDAPAATPPKGG